MGYSDRDRAQELAASEPVGRDLIQLGTGLIGLSVRILGVLLLLVGLWAGIQVIQEAWGLYRQPDRIQGMAQSIAASTRVDTLLAQKSEGARGASLDAAGRPAPAREAETEGVRISYFIAWALAVMLLLVVGRLAFWAVGVGGELALRNYRRPRRGADSGD